RGGSQPPRPFIIWCAMATPLNLFLEATRAPVTLGRKLGSGGEGVVHENGGTRSAVKLLHTPTGELEEKLRAMRLTPPKAPGVLPQGYAFSWPTDLVLSGTPAGPFVGFSMPLVSYRYALHQLYKHATRGPEVDERFLYRTAKNMAVGVT